MQVAFTGAFLTDPPLTVRIKTYDDLQTRLHNALAWPEWTIQDLRAQNGTYLGEGGGGFQKSLPLIIIRRQGDDLLPRLGSAMTKLSCASEDPMRDFQPIAAARPLSLTIDFYDLGVAVMTAWFDVTTVETEYTRTAKAIKSLAGLRSEAQQGSPLAEALQTIATATANQYRQAVTSAAPRNLQASWLSGDAATDGTSAGPSEDGGRLLWLHPVNVVCAENTDDCVKRIKELAPTFRKQTRVNGGIFAAGIGSSAVVVGRESSGELAPVRLTELHWAYYALYMQFDRGLLKVLNRERWTERKHLREFEEDADNIFADYLRVMDARARLDTDLISRGGDDMAIWNTISEVQRFQEIVTAVDQKLDVLEKLAERRVEKAAEARNFHITLGLGALSMLALVTLALSFWGSWSPTGDASNTQLWGIHVWDFRLWSGLALLGAVVLMSIFLIRVLRPSKNGPSS